MIVVDSSVVVDALSSVDGAEGLRDILVGEELHAPALLDHEVVSVVRGLTLGGHLTASRALDLLADFDDLAVDRWPAGLGLRRRAFELRHNLSAYDAAYVGLAEALRCRLVTRDRRLAGSAGHQAAIHLV